MTSVEVYNLDDHDFKEPLIAFAKGDHVIGRGDLKCNDKRVSRRHAIISVRDDAAELKAIHINPCFFKSSNGKSIKTLAQDTNIELHDGDMFALVADKFWFRVKLMNGKGVDDDRRLSKRNQNDEQETSSNKRAKIDVTSNTQDRPVDTTKFLENIQQIVSEDYRNTLDDSNNDSNESVDLLTLMQTRENELDSNSSLNATQNVETQNNGQDHSEAEKLSNSEAEAASNPENIYQTTEDDATKETNIAENSYSKSEPVSVKTEPKEDEDDSLKTEVPEGFSATVKKEPKIEPTEYDSRGASSSSAAAASTSGTSNKIARRDRCWYGASCYRKNPIHRQDFSHPGDADYDSDPDDDRPSCPFGNGCYRTNMDHRRQYKHSARPAPKPSSSVSRKARNGNTMQLSSSQDRDEDTDSEDDIPPTEYHQTRKTLSKI
ncbi:unnamed protein product [Callosobruchus maculatus]|uniref:FHA domain-containing protein n=1 Tax=Callosobruchus maculatus TaxID=64391 RepID=A0A653CTS8_CALMS|nr:unnamed protein product [Callosobruchus maculatus]